MFVGGNGGGRRRCVIIFAVNSFGGCLPVDVPEVRSSLAMFPWSAPAVKANDRNFPVGVLAVRCAT